MANETTAPTTPKQPKKVGFMYPKGADHMLIIGMKEQGGLKIPDRVLFKYGLYETDDPEIIAKLRKHPSNVANGKYGQEAFKEMTDTELTTYQTIQRTGTIPQRLWNEQIGLVNGTREYQRPTE